MYDFVASPLALLIGYDRYQGWFSNNDAGGAYTRFTKCLVDTSQVFLTCHAVDGPPSRNQYRSHTWFPPTVDGPTLGVVFSECLG